jgi:hypothetical protein
MGHSTPTSSRVRARGGAGEGVKPNMGARFITHNRTQTRPFHNQPTGQSHRHPGEPFGKAGAYGIQGLAGSFVRRIDGCFYNVVGFPVNEFSKQLLRLIDEGHMPLDE